MDSMKYLNIKKALEAWRALQSQPVLTLADMREVTGISVAAIQKLLDQLLAKKYVERGDKVGSWRVYVTQ